MTIPQEFVIQKFTGYTRRSSYKAATNSYIAECPVCLEGKSRGKKRRLSYILNEDFLICYNCNRSWSPAQWVKEVTGLTWEEIKREVNEGSFSNIDSIIQTDYERPSNPFTLPQDCINLFDEQQLTFYKDNQVVKDALVFIKQRRLDTAINKSNKLWISLKDYIHKNRIIIPFYDPDNQIRFYQSRAIYPKDEDIAKYFSKMNAEKTLYGVSNITPELDYIFLLEGPIDAMFIQNGIGVTGLKLTHHQQEILQKYSLFKKIWILDNEFNSNAEVKKQYLNLIEQKERVFIWPGKYKGFKDLNQLCVELKLDKIKPEFFIENSYTEQEALLKLSSK